MKIYLSKLKDPRWQKKRLEILERDNFTCQMCKDEETELHIHHKKYGHENPWDNNNEDLITYCKYCHEIYSALNKENINLIEIIKKDIFFIALSYDSNNTKCASLYFLNENILTSIMLFREKSYNNLNNLFLKSYNFFNK